jgi:hypothetical protein
MGSRAHWEEVINKEPNSALVEPHLYFILILIDDNKSTSQETDFDSLLGVSSDASFPNSSPSFSVRTLFKLLNGTFFYKKFLYESCFKKSN